jgi:hypothetical protein
MSKSDSPLTKRVRLDGATFLLPNHAADPSIEWLLRYGTEKQIIEARFSIAEIIAGFDHLLRTTAKDAIRTLRIMRREVRQ